MAKQPNCLQRLWQDRYGKNVQPDVRLFLDNMLACSVVAGLLIMFHQYEIWFYYRRFMRKPLTEIQLYKLNIEATGVKNWNQTFALHPFDANTPLNSMAASHSRMATIQTTLWTLRILYYLSFVYIAWFLYRYIGPLLKLGMEFVWICIFQYSIRYLLWEVQQLIKKALGQLNPVNIVKKFVSLFKKKKAPPPADEDYTKFDIDAKPAGPNWYQDFYSKWWNNYVMRWWQGEIEAYRRRALGSPMFRLIKTAVNYILLPFNVASKTLTTAKTFGVDAPYKEFKSSLGQLYPKLIEQPGEAWYDSAINDDWTIHAKLEEQDAAIFPTSFGMSKWTTLKKAAFYILIVMLFVAAVAVVIVFRRNHRTTFDLPTFLKHMKAMFSGIKV